MRYAQILIPIALITTVGACNKNEGGATVADTKPLGTPPDQPRPPLEQTMEPAKDAIVAGTIALDASMKDKMPPRGVVFVTARPAGQEGGMPSLVGKFAPPSVPFKFQLTPANLMMPGMPVPDQLDVTVRLDQDGDAISKLPGDLEGEMKGVSKGTMDVEVALKEAVTEFKPGRRIDAPGGGGGKPASPHGGGGAPSPHGGGGAAPSPHGGQKAPNPHGGN